MVIVNEQGLTRCFRWRRASGSGFGRGRLKLLAFFLGLANTALACGEAPTSRERSSEVTRATEAEGAVDTAAGARADQVGPQTVYIFYDEQSISDSSRAVLASILAGLVPEARWPTITVAPGDGLEAVVDSFYEVDARRYPSTARFLVSTIDSANRIRGGILADGEQLRIPPLPMRGFTKYPDRREIRTYRATTFGYGAAPDFENLTFADSSALRPASQARRIRAANVTVVELQIPGDVDRVLAQLPSEYTQPPGLVALPANGYARLQLFDSSDTSCVDAADWIAGSPYLDLLHQRLSALDATARAALEARGETAPLVIIDWNLDASSQGHGSRVASVAEFLLDNLGLADLSRHLRLVDLNPMNARDSLEVALESYRRHLEGSGEWTELNLEGLFARAKNWIRDFRPGGPDTEPMVHQLVLSSVLWQELAQASAWVNLSFTIFSPTYRVFPPAFIYRKENFLALAAGNSRTALNPNSVPQHKAGNFSNLVNITYGASSGEVLGSYSKSDDLANIPVSLVGPGCGFRYGTIDRHNRGSSYASPFVAVAAWLKYLLDGTSVRLMRRLLVAASRPAVQQRRPIESGGTIDIALLLASPPPHILTAGGELLPIVDGQVSVTYNEDGLPQTHAYLLDGDSPPLSMLLIYACRSSNYCLWLRTLGSEGFPTPTLLRRPLIDVTLDARTAMGDSIRIRGPEEYARGYRELVF